MAYLTDIFSQALRNQLTYNIPGKGVVNTEYLFQLNEGALSGAYAAINKEVQDSAGLGLATTTESTAATLNRLKMDVIKAVYEDKVARREAANEAQATKDRANRRMDLVATANLSAEQEIINALTVAERQKLLSMPVQKQDEILIMSAKDRAVALA
jgi:hypothetical protein